MRWVVPLAAAGRAPRARCGRAGRARARRADVVYTTGMLGRSSTGAAPRPAAVRAEADRGPGVRARAAARVWRRTTSTTFQPRPAASSRRRCAARATSPSAAPRTSSARARTCASSRSAGASTPSRVTVLPNPAPPCRAAAARRAPAELGVDGPTLAFAGRLTAQKSLEVALEAVAAVEGVELVVAGDGPERERLERHAASRGLGARVRFLGAAPRGRRARAVPRGRRDRPLVGLGELPARRRRVARGRHAGARDAGRAASPRSCEDGAQRAAGRARRRRTRSPPRSAATSTDDDLRRAAARSRRALGRRLRRRAGVRRGSRRSCAARRAG